MKIDTQGMSLSLDSNYKETKSVDEQREEIPKTTIQPTRLFTPEYVKEMKILINEVLDEREYNKLSLIHISEPTRLLSIGDGGLGV